MIFHGTGFYHEFYELANNTNIFLVISDIRIARNKSQFTVIGVSSTKSALCGVMSRWPVAGLYNPTTSRYLPGGTLVNGTVRKSKIDWPGSQVEVGYAPASGGLSKPVTNWPSGVSSWTKMV